MRNPYELLLAFLLATTSTASKVSAESHPPGTSRINPRFEQRYDQMRFMACVTNRDVKPYRWDRMIGYYSHPPRQNEHPAQIAYYEKHSTRDWKGGCSGSSSTHGKSSDGAEWDCDIPPYPSNSGEHFRNFMGTITYGYTGFNCFLDDGHVAHYSADGVCYTEMYCTHERYHSLALNASSLTVKPQYIHNAVEEGKKPNIPTENAPALVKSWLQIIRKNIGQQQCSRDPIWLTPNCQVKLNCGGTEPRYLQKLADALIESYAIEKNSKGEALYTLFESKKCVQQRPSCDLGRPGCFLRPAVCDYVKGVEIPSGFTMSLLSKVPPNADENNSENSIDLAHLEVDIQCATSNNNNLLCGALKTVFTGLAMIPPLSTVFGAASLGTEVACM